MTCYLFSQFNAVVQSQPQGLAVLDGEKQYNYRQLDRDSDRLARRLMKEGMGRDAVVALWVDRSYEMVTAVLAVLKAGAACLPLDPAYPEERLRYMLEDAQASALLVRARSELPGFAQAVPLMIIDEDPDAAHDCANMPLPERDGEQLFYVIYTSGSTGQPKGVAMVQGVFDHLLRWQLSDSSMAEGDRSLQFSPLSFDVSFQEIFATLCSGGSLVLISQNQRQDSSELLRVIDEQAVKRIFLPYVALRALCEAAVKQERFPAALREVITAGESLQVTESLRRFFSALPDCRLQNQYGPSESHVVTACTLDGPASEWPDLPAIGKPLPHVRLRLVDEDGAAVAEGAEGELLIGGESLARGYLNRPELTAERFITVDGERFYRSGDRLRQDEQGNYHFLGRKDGQLKLRGYRIEVAEIEVALARHAQVTQAVVDVRESAAGERRLVAWYTGEGCTAEALREFLGRSLPGYMLPARFVFLADFPRTPSGKLDRRALPAPGAERPDLACDFVPAEGELEQQIASVWEEVLEISPVGRHDNFFDLGGNSLLALGCAEQITGRTGHDVDAVALFANPTIRALALHLRGDVAPAMEVRDDRKTRGRSVAIIGMALRVPGANSAEEFWHNLLEGRESIRFFSREEVEAEQPGSWSEEQHFVAAKGVIDNPGRFDAAFFGISPREAQVLDPQQRIFLELAWQALEDSGYHPEAIAGDVGVYAGVGNNSYFANNLAGRGDLLQQVGTFALMTGNEKDYVAARVSHKLNLSGPALSVHTACSTSLVAVHQAVQALRAGECHLAIAGGATISAPQCEGYVHQEGAMLSADGHCRPFDAEASGTVFSDGAGAVILKLLDEAIADGDHIHAVIEGSAVNNDGGDKASFSAPNPRAQSRVILQAQRDAGVEAGSIGYVEAHGTATPLGDPIEVRALSEAFRANGGREGCLLGSVKSNFGHLTAAAGVTGLIKTALMVQGGRVPPTLHFQRPNPAIDWDAAGFRVSSEAQDWPQQGRRVAAVSSFGVGGNNAHVIVAEAPPQSRSDDATRPWHVLSISHRSESGLRRYERALAQAISREGIDDAALADAAFTLNTGRKRFRESAIVIANSSDLAAAALQERRAPFYRRIRGADNGGSPVFLFPGQGAQVSGMGQCLYESEAIFRESVDRSATFLNGLSDDRDDLEDIRALLYPQLFGGVGTPDMLSRTRYTQLALFTVEYALAELWRHWGVEPRAMFGHSIGEWVAACVAGCVSQEDALLAVYHRGRLMQAQAPGGMLSVQMPAEPLASLLPAELELAAVNSSQSCVVAGDSQAIDDFAAWCGARDIANRRLLTSHAFHSRAMEGALAEFSRCIENIDFKAPRIPFLSCVTGKWITEAEACSPDYWASQIRAPVQCAAALATLAEDTSLALELGPRNTLCNLFRQNAPRNKGQALPSLGNQGDGDGDWIALLGAVGALAASGAQFDWARFYERESRRRLPLPGYPFEGENYWINALRPAASLPLVAEAEGGAELTPQGEVSESSMMQDEKQKLAESVRELITQVTGIEREQVHNDTHFMEMGLDSLLLTQLATALRRELSISLGFRQLMEEQSSIDLLVDYAWENMDEALRARYRPVAQAQVAEALAPVQAGSVDELIRQQLALMERQLEMLRGNAGALAVPRTAARQMPPVEKTVRADDVGINSSRSLAARSPSTTPDSGRPDSDQAKARPFGAQARIDRSRQRLTPEVEGNLNKFIAHYTKRTAASRDFTQRNRARLADPRAVSGFSPLLKEMVYPIVVKTSDDARLWDLDGNEYLDLVNGFGSNFLGHGPDFIKQALHRQIESGLEIGPQTPLAGEVAALICEITGMERAALCNTGSEAVMGALRLARTVTGRNRILVFDGAYHGINDEAIVRAAANGRSVPAAAGIPPEAVANVVVMPYGSEQALQFVREQGDSLAAVLVEPVQSRRPDFQPGRFLTALRAATQEAGVALIFDEVITGFRIRPGGAQEYFGIRADLATYGKIIGGGMPIGAIAGSSEYMDALDGGYWRYGDDSMPEAGVTYFAGTFVRHPLAMAAARAALTFIREQGPGLQQRINEKTQALCDEVNNYYRLLGFPVELKCFGSLFKVSADESQALASLFFYKLRELGVHIWEGRPCFITLAHSDEHIAQLNARFKEAADFMLQNSFIEEATSEPQSGEASPVGDGARDLEVEPVEKKRPQEEPVHESVSTAVEAAGPTLITSTEAQREIWLAAQMGEEANCAFNEAVALRLEGKLNAAAMQAAVRQLIHRHEALRAHFSEDGRTMHVAPELELPVELIELRDDDHREQLRQAAVSRAFNLAGGPLLRIQLLRRGEEDHELLFTAHHIICDGWSIYLLMQELGELYRAYVEDEDGAAALPAAGSFAEFSRWENSVPLREKRAESLAFWRERLEASAPYLELPTDRPRPAIKSYAARRVDHRIGPELLAAMRGFASEQRATLTGVLLAAFSAFAHRLSGNDEVLLGMPFAGQLAKEDMQVAGHCVNLLPMKIPVSSRQSFAELLAQVREEMIKALDHQFITLGTLLQSLALERDPARPPLLSTLFNVDINTDEAWAFPGLDVNLRSLPRCFENFDLNLNITVNADSAVLECCYNTEMWDERSIRTRLKELETLLEAACATPDEPLAELPMMPPAEQLLWRRTCAGPRRELPAEHMNELLKLQAFPKAAVSCPEERVSFAELEGRANQLAHSLRARGVERGDRVGILLDRSINMLAALLAVWKAGAAYVPLDPHFPAQRLRYMAEAGELKLVVSEGQQRALLPPDSEGRVLLLDEAVDEIAGQPTVAPDVSTAADDTAYVIFTSGSSGKPKGVAIPHRALCNFLLAMSERPGIDASHRVLAITTLSFDIAALELFLPLMVGAQLVIAGRETALDGTRLQKVIDKHKINYLQATPATWRALLAAGWKGTGDLKALCGGEAFPPDLAGELLERAGEVWNMYGPTEATVWCTAYQLQAEDASRSNIPVGRPLANCTCYVLDADGNPLPAGVPGELYIGGDCLASGYLNQPVLTRDRFVDNSVDGVGKLYRSGDRARWLEVGGLECLGRLDNQVKLRGFRIELGEVEARLGHHPDVIDCAAVVKSFSASDQRLVAYARFRDGANPGATALRKYLREFLPDYMIPQLFVPLDVMPMTPNGKIDRRNLPEPLAAKRHESGRSPQSPTEQGLAVIWSDLLGREQHAAEELFFDVGGHSLLALDMIARVRERFGVRLSPLDILISNLAQLAAKIDSERAQDQGAGEASPDAEQVTEESLPPLGDNPARLRRPSLLGRLLGRATP